MVCSAPTMPVVTPLLSRNHQFTKDEDYLFHRGLRAFLAKRVARQVPKDRWEEILRVFVITQENRWLVRSAARHKIPAEAGYWWRVQQGQRRELRVLQMKGIPALS
ncbi:hypothetical protein TWF730_004451 [Orbilia blumenaviensis]|uniref:Uncharacterized protein n=1 Tax=Orbilia blumenaviensis TaxID=1796055 RepID=A0AAV9U0Z5_9PEZI